MNISVQIFCFVVSFVFGIFIRFWACFNKKFITGNTINKLIVNFVWGFIVVILYIILIYLINGGIFHLYFILALYIGYLVPKKF
jgi:hypothetical protein